MKPVKVKILSSDVGVKVSSNNYSVAVESSITIQPIPVLEAVLSEQFHPIVVDYISRVEAKGGSIDSTRQRALNNLILRAKANGWLDTAKKMCLHIEGDTAAFGENLMSDDYHDTFPNGCTKDPVCGFTVDGVSQYGKANLAPNEFGHASAEDHNYMNCGVHFLTLPSTITSKYIAHSYDGTNSMFLGWDSGDIVEAWLYTLGHFSGDAREPDIYRYDKYSYCWGWNYIYRNDPTNGEGAKESVLLGWQGGFFEELDYSSTKYVNTLPSSDIYWLAQNDNGTPLSFTDGKVAVTWAGTGTASQTNTMQRDIKAFLSEIGVLDRKSWYEEDYWDG